MLLCKICDLIGNLALLNTLSLRKAPKTNLAHKIVITAIYATIRILLDCTAITCVVTWTALIPSYIIHLIIIALVIAYTLSIGLFCIN